MNNRIFAAFILSLACPHLSTAAEKSTPGASGGQSTTNEAEMNKTIKMESRQPMNMDEPMPTGMAKPGMKKGDVKTHAKKQEATMDEMMRQEEMKQSPPPPH